MADRTAPALQTETRAGTVFAWNRKNGDWAVRLNDRVPGSWPQTKEQGITARLASAVHNLNAQVGTDFTENEARQIAQRLTKRVRRGFRYAPAKYARRLA